MNAVKFLGTSDDVTTCECCGRSNLKSTVALELTDGTDPVYFGVTCAAHALKRTTKEIKSESRAADRARFVREMAERAAKHQADNAPWHAFLAEHGRGADDFRRIESLGGYAAARARFYGEVA